MMFIGRSFFQQVVQCVESKSEWIKKKKKKKVYGAKRMPKQKTISNSNSILILGISVTFSRHNGKCNIFAFHEVLSIDFDRCMTSEGSDTLILPFTSKMQNRHKIVFTWVSLLNRGDIVAFYRSNFRLQTYKVLEIELNEQECLPFLIDFYIPPPILGIPDFHCHLSRHYRNSGHVSCRVVL